MRTAALAASRRRKGLAAVVAFVAVLGAGAAMDLRDQDDAHPAVRPPLTGVAPAVAPVPSLRLPPPMPAWSYSPPPLPVPAGDAVPVGQTVVIDGDSGEEMHLTLVSADDPAPYQDPHEPGAPDLVPALGHRLVTAIIRVENVGGVPFVDDLENHTRVVGRDGTEYDPDTGMTGLRNRRPAARLDPRYLSSRQIVFEVRGDVDLALLRVRLGPGADGGTQDWTLT